MKKAILGLSWDHDSLLEDLVAGLSERGIRVSVLLETQAGFDLDRPGKDSFLHRQAGASEVMVSSTDRWALLHENDPPNNLPDIRRFASGSSAQLLLVGGFDGCEMDRLWVVPPERRQGTTLDSAPPPDAIAIVQLEKPEPGRDGSGRSVAEVEGAPQNHLPCFSAAALDPLIDFLLHRYGLTPHPGIGSR